MEENTPRFFQNIEKAEELESLFSFSVEYKKIFVLNLIRSIIQKIQAALIIILDQSIKNQKQIINLNLINLNYLNQILTFILIKKYLPNGIYLQFMNS